MPFYGDDFFGADDVSAWPEVTQIIYLRCLWRQWQTGHLQGDPKVISANIGVPWARFKGPWQTIASKFPVCDDNLRRNQRLADLLEAAKVSREGRAKGGHRAADARRSAHAQHDAQRTLSTRSASGNKEEEEEYTTTPTRLTDALSFWDSKRPPNIAPSPKVTPALIRKWNAVDAPSVDWDAVIDWTFANPYTNGLGAARKGHAEPFRADFSWLLTPKNLELAQTKAINVPSVTASPQKDRDMKIVLDSMRITENSPPRKALT